MIVQNIDVFILNRYFPSVSPRPSMAQKSPSTSDSISSDSPYAQGTQETETFASPKSFVVCRLVVKDENVIINLL